MSSIAHIPVGSINILNPRSRNKRIFQTIIANIGTLGLKRPITVTRRLDGNTEKPYDLVCGQGRLEAYQALGEATIPAMIIETTKDEAYLMSLVENIARRKPTPVELLKEITLLKEAGLSADQIAARLDLDRAYVYTALHLLDHGEHALLKEVERGHIPVSVAMRISTAADHDLQAALRQAYATGELRGAQLLATKRYLAKHKQLQHTPNAKRLSAQAAVRAYKQFTNEHKAFVKRARQTEQRLLLITTALKKLLLDEHFTNLLRAERLETLPTVLADRIRKG